MPATQTTAGGSRTNADSPPQLRTSRAAAALTCATLLAGAGNYGLSLLMVHLLAPAEYVRYATASNVLLAVGTFAGATMPALVTRELADRPHGPVQRARGVRLCLRTAGVYALICAAGACAACATYAGPALTAAVAAAAVLLWTNATGAGLLQSRQDFGRLAVLWPAEAAVRAVASLAFLFVGRSSAGAVAGIAAGAAATAGAAFLSDRRPLPCRTPSAPHRPPPGPAGGGPATGRRAPWRRAASIGGAQALMCLLPSLDVVVATAVRSGSPELAPYQALLVLARVPLYAATALAAVLLPQLATTPVTTQPAASASTPTAHERIDRTPVHRALRLHWAAALTITVAVVTCPRPLLALVVPPSYAGSAALLLPLGIAGVAAATLTVTATVFLAWGPLRQQIRLLAAACPAGALLYAATAGQPVRLAWSAALLTTVTAAASLVLAGRRIASPLWRTAAAWCATAAAVACVLYALRGHTALWCLAVLALAATAPAAVRDRQPTRTQGPLRVLHLAFEDPRSPGAGGGSVRTHEVNRRLASYGVEVTAVCAPWPGPGCTPTVHDGVRYLPLPGRLGPLNRSGTLCRLAYFCAVLAGLWRLIRRMDPDLVVEDFAAPFSSVCVPWLTRRPVVGVVQWLAAAEKTEQYGLPFHLVERLGLRSHSRLVAVSEGLAAELRRRRPGAQVTALPNGIDRAAFTAPAGAAREHVLYLGRLETSSKGLDLLLRAYASAAPRTTCDLLIAGDGPDAETARSLARKLGVEGRTRWLGRVEGAVRYALLAGARLVCVPSRYETFGLVAAEALATRTPVLAFDIPNVRDLVTDAVGVRVPPEDVRAYGDALADLAADPARCRRLGRAGPATVAHLDWDAVARAQLALYERAVGRERNEDAGRAQ
ncbi:glycosyltransferase [Streptomyces marispadix]|uniref:D-inositol 3-phosphate glycosyltransferase n=1 Tax=Streptomyces marispadix TaxID=2922868 RepID=A0ABS9SX24_9ACTN|nr:glycosyltransferase [Streptomyces marispadix]MCH6160837.1 glycosyltransferase [Streptomyces marispadix]